jgi:hypothetical protein
MEARKITGKEDILGVNGGIIIKRIIKK